MWNLKKLMDTFEEANFKPIHITMDNGDILKLTPYNYTTRKKNRNNIVYIVVDGSIDPWLSDTPKNVVNNLNNYDERIAQAEKEIKELRAFYMEATNNQTTILKQDDYEIVKEWHKVAFGVKPENTFEFLK